MSEDSTAGSVAAEQVHERLARLRADAGGELPKREVFAVAKQSQAMPIAEIERLLDRDDHDDRVAAVSIMDFQARGRRTPAARKEQLYELYLGRHDRIDTWDLVDRAAPYVVGQYLYDKPRRPLYALAESPYWFERRTAIVATYYFIRLDDLDDTFAIADRLADDPHHYVQKAVGSWLREAGKRDVRPLIDYLDRHAATMPRIALRYAIEKLDPSTRRHYLELGSD